MVSAYLFCFPVPYSIICFKLSFKPSVAGKILEDIATKLLPKLLIIINQQRDIAPMFLKKSCVVA